MRLEDFSRQRDPRVRLRLGSDTQRLRNDLVVVDEHESLLAQSFQNITDALAREIRREGGMSSQRHQQRARTTNDAQAIAEGRIDQTECQWPRADERDSRHVTERASAGHRAPGTGRRARARAPLQLQFDTDRVVLLDVFERRGCQHCRECLLRRQAAHRTAQDQLLGTRLNFWRRVRHVLASLA